MGESRESYLRRREQNHGKSYQLGRTLVKITYRIKEAEARHLKPFEYPHKYAKTRNAAHKNKRGLSIADKRKVLLLAYEEA